MADPSRRARLEAARGELRAALAHLRETNARVAEQTKLTQEEKDNLSAAARQGEMGPEMRELAAKVDRREDSWEAIFSGDSPNSGIYRPFFERAAEEFRDDLKQQFEQDDTIQEQIEEVKAQQRRGELG